MFKLTRAQSSILACFTTVVLATVIVVILTIGSENEPVTKTTPLPTSLPTPQPTFIPTPQQTLPPAPFISITTAKEMQIRQVPFDFDYEEGPVEEYGFIGTPNSYRLRIIAQDFTDRIFPMIGYPERKTNMISDQAYGQEVMTKMDLWSNSSFQITPNNGKIFMRINTGYKYSKHNNCNRQNALKLAKKKDPGLEFQKSKRKYFAVICHRSAANGALTAGMSLGNGSLPSLFHELAHNIGFGHCGKFHRRNTGEWKVWSIYGDLLTASGAMIRSRGLDVYGPELFLPMHKYGLGWHGNDKYIYLVPGRTYRLRTLGEQSIRDTYAGGFPMALVWMDRVYDHDVWFSFWKSGFVFGEGFVKEYGSNAIGNDLGWATHIWAGGRKNTLQVEQFGRVHTHHSGLTFETIEANDKYVDVRVTYDPTQQFTYLPIYNVKQTIKNTGGSSTAASVVVEGQLLRKYDELTMIPFSVTNRVTVVCPWGTFLSKTHNKHPAPIAPNKKFGGDDDARRWGKNPGGKKYQHDFKVVVEYKTKGKLTNTQQQENHDCVVRIGRYMEVNVKLTFS